MLGSSFRQGVRAARNVRWASSAPSGSGPSTFRRIRTVAAATSLAVSAYTVGSLYPPELASLLAPRAAPAPLHPDHPQAIAHAAEIEDALQNLGPLQLLRKSDDAAEWYEVRAHVALPEERRVNSLTAGTLKGPGKIAAPPLVRARKDDSEAWAFLHLGRALCGHDGVVHGGMIATMLDEAMARVCILNLPEKVGVTAYLNIDYKAPTKADQFVVIKVKLEEVKGRKASCNATVEDMQGTVLAKANALFVQPRYAKLLKTSEVRQMLGHPPDSKEPIIPGSAAPLPIEFPAANKA